MYVFTTRALDFVYTTVGRVKFVYFFRISPVKLKFSMDEQQPQQRRDKIKFSCKLLLFNSFKEKAENNFDSPHNLIGYILLF